MDQVIAASTSVGTDSLKSMGAFALSLILLGVACWYLSRQNAALRAEVSDLHSKRLEDVRTILQVTAAATETIKARGESDQKIAAALAALGEQVLSLRDLLVQLLESARAAGQPVSRPPRRVSK